MLLTWSVSEHPFEGVDDLEAVARHVRRRLQADGIRSTLITTPDGAYRIRVDTTSPFNPAFATWLDVRLERSGQETLATLTRNAAETHGLPGSSSASVGALRYLTRRARAALTGPRDRAMLGDQILAAIEDGVRRGRGRGGRI